MYAHAAVKKQDQADPKHARVLAVLEPVLSARSQEEDEAFLRALVHAYVRKVSLSRMRAYARMRDSETCMDSSVLLLALMEAAEEPL